MTHEETEPLVTTTLEAEVAALDASTISRLQRARHAAVAEVGPRGSRRGFLAENPWALPIGAIAGFAVIASAPLVVLHSSDSIEPATVAYDETSPWLEIAEADVDLDLLEDLEFYHWLEIAPVDGGSS